MDSPSDGFRFREIQKLLYNQLHVANETLRIAKMNGLSRVELDRASAAATVAYDRWNALVSRRETPEDLKDWDGTGTPP
jgi:hypothetical protein